MKFAVINQQDGVIAFPEVSEAVQIMADHFNSQGGIGGHLLEIELCTTGDDPESAQACAQRFANDDSVQFVYMAAVFNSGALYPILGPEGANKPILAGTLWDVPDALQPGLYSSDPGLLPLAYEALRYAVEEDGVTNLAVVVDDTDVGAGTLAVVDFFLAGFGGAISTPVPIAPGQADFLAPLTAAGIDSADGLALLITDPAGCQPTRDALEALGRGDLPVYLGEWCVSEEFREAGTSEGWRIVMGHRGAEDGDPEAQQLRQIYADAGAGSPVGLAFSHAKHMDFARQILELAINKADGGLPSSEDIHAAATEWSGSLFIGPDTVSCPGAGAWVSNCNTAARMITLQDGEWVALTGYNLIDVTLFDPLLAG